MINSSRVVKPSFLLKLPGLLNHVYYINNRTGREFHTRVLSTTMEQSVVSTPTKVNIVVAGEHLRTRLLSERPSLIKDRRYHLRVYPTCFVARDLVDWLIEHLEASDRNVAVKCMRVLQENNIIHHGKK